MWHYSGALLHEKAFAGGSWLLKIGITTSAELLLIYVNCKVKKPDYNRLRYLSLNVFSVFTFIRYSVF